MKITCKSAVTAEVGDCLTVAEVRAWVSDLPHDAAVRPHLREIGSQRDPVTALGGLWAEWQEER